MCKHGTLTYVNVIYPGQSKSSIPVDSCIAEEIQSLNDQGIVTLGCCCGHGRAGEPVEWENGFGKWQGEVAPPHVLINEASVESATQLGYRPFKYYYADGEHTGVYQMYLKTGDLELEEV